MGSDSLSACVKAQADGIRCLRIESLDTAGYINDGANVYVYPRTVLMHRLICS